ncbi:hypothetical protein AB0424_19790 [Streptomyces sp. NPDC051180]|uniref:hypothetical protein n=1 Tax=Streptomyces sp. NPDC051180 TaxID=3155797 RepID=UPI00345049E8
MTDLSTEPVLTSPQPETATVPSLETVPATQEKSKEVEHTVGGWPVLPLATTGANASVTLLAGAALVGGPVAAAVAMTGAVVLGAAAHTRKTSKARQAKPGKANGGSAGSGRVPAQPKRGSTTSSKPGTRSAAGSSTGGRKAGRGPSGTLRSASTAATGTRKPSTAKKAGSRSAGLGSLSAGSSAAGKPRGRVEQVKALREQARSVQPSKAGRRAEATAARRQVADARRHAKTAARTTAAARKGPVGRTVGKAAGRVGAARGGAVGKLRKARDKAAAGKVAAQRSDVRKAPARAKARKALWKSAARFQGRRLLAALLAGALGLVGMLTTPLGRKLGWAWLQHPGRRLYHRLVKTAADQRQDRDEAIREQRESEEAATDAEAEQQDNEQQIGEAAERPAGLVPTTATSEVTEGESVSGFRFEEYAAEMEAAANSYEPENAMEILAMVEGLPAALTSVANVMKVLAERADSEFPLEKPVADGFNDIYAALMGAVEVAEDMGPLFREAHEQDIARHEDPRNGPEAEKGWNV